MLHIVMIVRLSYCFLKIGICQGQMISWGKLAAMKKKKNANKDRRLSWGWAKGGGGATKEIAFDLKY